MLCGYAGAAEPVGPHPGSRQHGDAATRGPSSISHRNANLHNIPRSSSSMRGGRAPEKFHDSNRLPAELATALRVRSCRLVLRAGADITCLDIAQAFPRHRSGVPLFPGRYQAASLLCPSPFCSFAMSQAEPEGIRRGARSSEQEEEDVTADCIDARCPGLHETPRTLPRGRWPLAQNVP